MPSKKRTESKTRGRLAEKFRAMAKDGKKRVVEPATASSSSTAKSTGETDANSHRPATKLAATDKPVTDHQKAQGSQMSGEKEVFILLIVAYALIFINTLATCVQGSIPDFLPSLWDLLVTAVAMAILGSILPAMSTEYWILPTSDGLDLEMMGFADLFLALVFIVVAFMLVGWIVNAFNKAKLHREPTGKLAEEEPCPLRIGAFNAAEEGKFLSDFSPLSPRLPRTKSEFEAFNLESGRNGPHICKRRGSPTPPKAGGSRHKSKNSNPAYPLLVDFAGAGYEDIIAQNRKSLELSGEGSPLMKKSPGARKKLPTSPTHFSPKKLGMMTSPSAWPRFEGQSTAAPVSVDPIKKPSTFRSIEPGYDRCKALQQSLALRMEIAVLEEKMREDHKQVLEHEKILKPMLKAHDRRQLMRKALDSVLSSNTRALNGESTVTFSDPDEAKIQKAFPLFTAIVTSPHRFDDHQDDDHQDDDQQDDNHQDDDHQDDDEKKK